MSVLTIVFSTLIAPVLVGVILTTYKYWLENRKR
ncbi:TPA: type I toxin-antitoxin system Fst family toxin [Staphylococcus aureus]|nr:type I toxin-antitoxin system Fst family toxin [Staphylococcus aureus]HDY9552936.1 type I toxin-antitoxin system Fst family toxin [Staphylococcus argenteus]MBH4593601.1 type I toxin-antitoxin system Fst family toxin [Staphylococcus aureus]MBH4606765.1 type I toxin-antitoxin system Fst family toxin [Staphylococcus aureus]MBH4617296.1 type I toxin-antitoxin system Fst family toxin [Staphylococcus aureus]MBH4622597.1 type I toxin-antitoxin system Fst family toxin [Staphylococcus aureus]